MKCPWCPWEGPIDQYSSHVDQKHSNILPTAERQSSSQTHPGYLYAGPGYTPTDKEYHVKYMEKDTYKTKEVDLTGRELTEFYQNKPYEQIIDVHKIPKK